MNKRRIFLLVICGALILSTVGLTIVDSIKNKDNKTVEAENDEQRKLKVVCTIFPEYDWARNIIGNNDKVELSLIVKNGVDLHSFQPSTADVVEITSADVFIYVGGVSDNWVTDVLANAKNPKMKVVNLMDVIGDRAVMTEHHEGEEEGRHSHIMAPDEHIWLSLENAKLCVRAIAKALDEASPSQAFGFNKNCSSYLYQLNDLDDKFKTTIENSPKKTLIFCDRFPFTYLVQDYGLNYYAAFTGCSAETEASFETIAFLSDKLKETGLKAVFTIDNGDTKIADTVISSSKVKDCQILTLDSMQSTTLDQAKKGKTYIGTMENNLKVLKKGLGLVS